jgi:GAF domain-containing protein/HAMP domain-containing protein
MLSQPGNNRISTEAVSPRGSLRNTFLLVVLPISIISLLLIGGLTYIRARNAISNQVNLQLSANLDSLVTNFNSWITIRHIRLDLAVRHPELKTALEQTLSSPAAGDQLESETREYILEQLQEITSRREGLLFNQFIITIPDGTIIIASQPEMEGQTLATAEFYNTLSTSLDSMAVYGKTLSREDEINVITGIPYFDEQNRLQATVFGISGPLSMIGLLEDVTRFNPIAHCYLITQSHDFIRVDPYLKTITRDEPSLEQGESLLPIVGSLSVQASSGDHILTTTTFDGTPVIANIAWLPSLDAALVVEIPEDIAFGELNKIGPYTLAITLALGALLTVAIWVTTQRLVGPLKNLTNSTQKFAQGKWEQRARVSRRGEVGLLSQAFNRMAEDLTGLYRSLETQVAERTRSLEKRSHQLEATAQVAREAAAIRNLDDLLTYTTQLISEQFDFYHIGIFLVDKSHQYAILQAANSPGGQRMLQRGHRLEVGQEGVVGYVAASGLPRIALDVGSDAFFFDNPDLPDTRSELALPLKVRNLVIGVMDVQSTKPSAFEESDIEILQILADQIALALDNTRLYEQSQEIIRELQNAYQSQTKIGWSHRINKQPIAYHFDGVRITPAADSHFEDINLTSTRTSQIEDTEIGSTLSVPLILRDQIIGSIILRRDPGKTPWTASDLSIVTDAINQVVAALDNARLLDESRRTATREQVIGEITAKIRETLDIETIAKTATEEIRQALDLSEVSIHLGSHTPDQEKWS